MRFNSAFKGLAQNYYGMKMEGSVRLDPLFLLEQSHTEKLKNIPSDAAILHAIPLQEFQFSFENLQVFYGFSFVYKMERSISFFS
jgi:hypothetical protein